MINNYFWLFTIKSTSIYLLINILSFENMNFLMKSMKTGQALACLFWAACLAQARPINYDLCLSQTGRPSGLLGPLIGTIVKFLLIQINLPITLTSCVAEREKKWFPADLDVVFTIQFIYLGIFSMGKYLKLSHFTHINNPSTVVQNYTCCVIYSIF